MIRVKSLGRIGSLLFVALLSACGGGSAAQSLAAVSAPPPASSQAAAASPKSGAPVSASAAVSSAAAAKPSASAASSAAPAKPSASVASPELDALIAAAKAEGGLTYYSASPESVPIRLSDAFQKQYGFKPEFIRIPSAGLLQRYSAEASSGKFAADLILVGGGVQQFADDAVKKGWVDALADSNLPALKGGAFPQKFLRGAFGVVQILPYGVTYNKNLVQPADVPRTWQDVADPKFKDKTLLADPRAGDAFYDIWDLLLQTYGEPFFDKIRANKPRLFPSGAPAIESLSAGEGSIVIPSTGPLTISASSRGAPITLVTPDLDTGAEIAAVITSKAKAPHPNAGRLLANYVLSEEGNRVLNADPGNVSVYDTAQLPKDYRAPRVGATDNKDKILKLLGIAS